MKNKVSIEIDEIIDEDIKELMKINLPDPEVLDYYKRINNREILWNGEIYDELVNQYQLITDWNREDKDIPVEDRKPIKILINSNGGDLESVMNFIDIIKLSKTPIITIGLAKCYSAGGLLLMSGHKRYIFSNTRFLLHDGSTGAMGNTGKVLDNLEFTQKTETRLKEYILNNTKISEEMYDKNYRRDWFMFSDEIINYGVADKIITDLEDIF